MKPSVFRRGGQKAELFLNLADDDTDYSQETDAKLRTLLSIWSQPRLGGHLSGAVWRPDFKVAEVLVKRGKQLDKMGYTRGSRHFLHIEEAVFLMDRADLLLAVEVSPRQGRPMTLQEGFELMAALGVGVEAYQVYWHLRRSGFMVKRYPALWVLKPGQQVSGEWGVPCYDPRPPPSAIAAQAPPPPTPQERAAGAGAAGDGNGGDDDDDETPPPPYSPPPGIGIGIGGPAAAAAAGASGASDGSNGGGGAVLSIDDSASPGAVERLLAGGGSGGSSPKPPAKRQRVSEGGGGSKGGEAQQQGEVQENGGGGVDGGDDPQQQQQQQRWWPDMSAVAWLEGVPATVGPDPKAAAEAARAAAEGRAEATRRRLEWIRRRLRPFPVAAAFAGAEAGAAVAAADPGQQQQQQQRGGAAAADERARAAPLLGGLASGLASAQHLPSYPYEAPACPVFDVYAPNPSFSRKRPDPVSFRAAVVPGVPSPGQLRALHAALRCEGAVKQRRKGGGGGGGGSGGAGGKAGGGGSRGGGDGGKGKKGGGGGKAAKGGGGKKKGKDGSGGAAEAAEDDGHRPPLRIVHVDKGDLSFFDASLEGLPDLMAGPSTA